MLVLLIWWLAFRVAREVRKPSKGTPGRACAHQRAWMGQVLLVGYLVGGAFLQLAYFDLPYNILVILVVVRRWLREGAGEKVGAFNSRDPTSRPASQPIAPRALP